MRRRPLCLATLVAGGASVVLLSAAAPTDAAPRRPRPQRKPRPAIVARIDEPLGLQGAAGAGTNVVIPFTLSSASLHPTEIQAEYGLDLNGDGSLTTDEYRKATEDRLDPRNTRSNLEPQLFVTAGDFGAYQAFVWRSTADVQSARHLRLNHLRTDQGRLIPDPASPGEALLDDAPAGVRVRIRTVVRWRKRNIFGAWATSPAFDLDNSRPPAARIDGVSVRIADDGARRVDVAWTGIDADSEDRNDNGRFDAGEDVNGNGVFDQAQLGVAFDWHRLSEGEDPAAMPALRLEQLSWSPCTRAAGEGDQDSFRASNDADGDRVYGAPHGRRWTFVWDPDNQVGGGTFILRARPIDQTKSVGDSAWYLAPFTLPDR
jgi:hypothetical protein